MTATGWGARRCPGQDDRGIRYTNHIQYEHAWLEVDERGYLWRGSQLDAITERIERAHKEGRPVLLAAYVHGWNDNANEDPRAEAECSDGSGQVDKFYALMGRVGDNVERMADAGAIAKKPLIIGVWVGWRGADYPSWNILAKPVSFASRGRVADTIGKAPDKKGLISLRQALKTIDKELDAPDDRMLVWGLSFGGRIITRMFRDDVRDGQSPLRDTSLIVTLNPAVGADCFEGLEHPSSTRVPSWVNISSHDDRARGFYYKAGALLFMDDDWFCEKASESRRTALGFKDDQITHKLYFNYKGTGYPAGKEEKFGPTKWASSPEPNYSMFFVRRSLAGKYSNGGDVVEPGTYSADGDKYTVDFYDGPGDDRVVWVIDTDRNSIGNPKNIWSIVGRHSYVFQTNLVRFVMLRLYDQDASSPRVAPP